MSLFGGVAASAAPRSRVRVLVEFKAGMMNLRGKMVYPDERKGFLYIYQSTDMLMHLCWRDRSADPAEPHLDLVIFPGEVDFKKVTQNTTGRVYILKWKTTTRKLFFWMQEPRADKDKEFCDKINDFLEHPPTPVFGAAADDNDDDGAETRSLLPSLTQLMDSASRSGLSSNDLSNILRMNPTELASFLGSVGHSSGGGGAQGSTASSTSNASAQSTTANNRSNVTRTTVTASTNRNSSSSNTARNDGRSSSSAPTVPKTTTSTRSKTGPIQISALTNVLSSLSNAATPGGSSKPDVDLYDLVDSENLIPVLSNKDVQEKFRVYLPEGNLIPRTERELRMSVQSPQFRQIVNAFSTALQLGELGPILAQSGFPDDVCKAASQGDLQAFAKALENDSNSSDDSMDANE